MSNLPFSPINPVQPSDFIRNDIPAETDDLQLGNKTPEDRADEEAERGHADRPRTVPQVSGH